MEKCAANPGSPLSVNSAHRYTVGVTNTSGTTRFTSAVLTTKVSSTVVGGWSTGSRTNKRPFWQAARAYRCHRSRVDVRFSGDARRNAPCGSGAIPASSRRADAGTRRARSAPRQRPHALPQPAAGLADRQSGVTEHSNSPARIVGCAPGASVFAALTRSPLNFTLPPTTAACARLRVAANRAAQSHLSRRTANTLSDQGRMATRSVNHAKHGYGYDQGS